MAVVPLALYLGAAALYLLLWWRQRRPVDAVLVGLLAGAAVFLAIVFLITYVAALNGNALAKTYLDAAGAPIAALIVGWLGLRSPFHV